MPTLSERLRQAAQYTGLDSMRDLLIEAAVALEGAAPQPPERKPLTVELKQLNHCAIAVSDWLAGGCDVQDIPRPHIAALVAFGRAASDMESAHGIKD